MLSNSGNRLLVFGCGRSVSGTHRNSAAEGGQLPGLPEERMPAGLVLIHGRAHGARIAAQPAEAVGARCTPPGQIPGLAAADAAAVTRCMPWPPMTSRPRASLALARLGDGAPGRCGPVMVTAWPPRTGHEGTGQIPVPRGSGHRHPRPAHRRRQHRLPRQPPRRGHEFDASTQHAVNGLGAVVSRRWRTSHQGR